MGHYNHSISPLINENLRWTHRGYIVDTSWIHRGYIVDTSWIPRGIVRRFLTCGIVRRFLTLNISGAPAAEGRQAEPHTHISGAPAAEGRQAEPHTHIRKLKGTHELIFSCVSWLAVLLVGAYARRRRRRRRRWWSRATWRPQLTRKPKRHVNPWFKASFGHPCCSQLTPVKTRNPLTSIT